MRRSPVPEIQRTEPPYMQLAQHYERLIRDGELGEGDRLPSVRQLAEEWGVVRATVTRAMRHLQAAQLVSSTKAGTVVRKQRALPAPRDRVLRALQRQHLDTEQIHVTDAGIVTRVYVARLLGLGDTAAVIRREQITLRGDQPTMLSVHWLPAGFSTAAPELLECRELDTLEVVRQATGRVPEIGDDGVSAREADEREASALEISPGTAILAGVWTCRDPEGVIEYGEYVCPPERVVTYRYEIPRQDEI